MRNLIVVVFIVVAIAGFSFISNNKSEVGQKKGEGQEIPILGRDHVQEGTKVTNYNSNPPTSGDHWERPADWGLYNVVLPDEQLVHNLEHGGIWISFKDKEFHTSTGSDEEKRIKLALEQIAKKYPQAVILTPRPQNDSRIVLASWGRLDKLESFDEKRIERFIKANINNSPEPLASLDQSAIRIDAPFPDFSVNEVGGKTITKDSLKGKPAIVWFTTSWCVPCQIGARDVSKLDNELGGEAFNVLVIFVDLREKDSDLINWRKSFANEDWMVAFDNELTNLAKEAEIRFLDSKFLLDKNGIIKNIDFKQADENYLNTIEKIVKENT